MPVTLMALYRTPQGGGQELETFRRRYADEHLPLVRRTPGLISLTVDKVAQAFGDTDLVLVTQMVFEDRAHLDAALASDPMRDAGRNLREIAPGMSTLIVLEPDSAMEPTVTSALTIEALRESGAAHAPREDDLGTDSTRTDEDLPRA